MFTFGRDHEVQVALRRHGGSERGSEVVAIVNAIHDFLENKVPITVALGLIGEAIIAGRRDVWEAGATWLLKLTKHAEARDVWLQLAHHSKAEVRFRVASFIDDLPNPLASELFELLKDDQSRRVRQHAIERWDMHEHPERTIGRPNRFTRTSR